MISFVFGAWLHLNDQRAVTLVGDKVENNRSVFPDATTTGVPSGVSLVPSGRLVIDTPGALVENLDITGGVVINAPNVTLRNCKVSSSGDIVVQINADGAVVQNCEITNLGVGGMGISGAGTFINNNIHDCADGINIAGDNSVIKGNYIHAMAGSSRSHFDSIQADGKFSNLLIEHNSIINEHTQTSALMLDNYWGPIDNVTINDNLLVGGGYTVYINEVAKGQPGGGRVTNVYFTNNVLVRGYYGFLDIRSELGDRPHISGNRIKTTGEPIPGQEAPAVKR